MKRLPWVALVMAVLSGLGWAAIHFHLQGQLWIPPCPMKQITGIPCISCGLTRCLLSLARGEVRQAFYWHPMALIGLGLMPALGVWDLCRWIRGKDYPPLPEKPWARMLALGILAGTWCVQLARGI